MNEQIKINKSEFINNFDNLYKTNKTLIYTAFEQKDYFTLSEQMEIFDGLKNNKQRCNLFNTISVEARPFVI